MENEENRGLIHKKAFEDQLARFDQFNVGDFPLLSLSLSLTPRHLEFSWITLALAKERKRRKEEEKIKQGNIGSSKYNKLHYRY